MPIAADTPLRRFGLALCALIACGHAPAAGSRGGRDATVDCESLARLPHAPMSVETCKARMAAQRDLSTAMDDPAGVRAGDEAMTCTAIIAEMQSIGFQGIDQATAEAARRAGEGLRTTYDRAHADAAALAARQSAAAAAAMLAPQPVQGALSLAQSAEQAALAKRAAAELGAARTRSAATTADAMSELAARLQAHPRYARLMALVQARGCTMDDAPSAPAASDGARPRD